MTSNAFPSLNFSKLDLSKLDLSKLDLPGVDTDKVLAALRDAAYVTIGFGVLAVQQAQVRRRELVTTLSTRFGIRKDQIDSLLGSMESQIKQLDERFAAVEARLDAAVEQLEARLPEQAGVLVGQAHELAKAARKQVRGLIASAA
jgi:hypothetical protein